MPQIIVKGVNSREMPKMAVECSAKLADICQCPQDWLFLTISIPIFMI